MNSLKSVVDQKERFYFLLKSSKGKTCAISGLDLQGGRYQKTGKSRITKKTKNAL
jgi:hypothetical protein